MVLMQNELDRIMGRITNTLSSSARDSLRKVVLYGSYARGDYANGSDVDIMVLVDAPNPDNIYAVIKSGVDDLSLEHLVMISCHFQNYEHFYKAIGSTSFYKAVEREGVVYFDASK